MNSDLIPNDPERVRNIYPSVTPQWPFNEPPKTRESSQPVYNIQSDTNLKITMRDGVKIAADVFRPSSGGQKFPALLAISPYTKGLQSTNVPIAQNEAGITEFWVPRGYAHIIVDSRGTNDSEGKFNNRGEIDVSKSKPGRPWHPHDKKIPLTPHQTEVFEIEIVPTANVFLKDHRIRLEICSCASVVKRVAYLDTLAVKATNTVIEGHNGSYLLFSSIPS